MMIVVIVYEYEQRVNNNNQLNNKKIYNHLLKIIKNNHIQYIKNKINQMIYNNYCKDPINIKNWYNYQNKKDKNFEIKNF